MVGDSWLENAKSNLLPKSKEKNNFRKAKLEWQYVGLEDNQVSDYTCQLCTHEKIRYENTIKNNINANTLVVGSSCILQFIKTLADTNDYLTDQHGQVIDQKRLEEDKRKYWKSTLLKCLHSKFSNNGFQKSITSLIEDDKKLTIKQAVCMMEFYNSLEEEEKIAYCNVVQIKLRKIEQKEQYNALSPEKQKFITTIATPSQKKILENL